MTTETESAREGSHCKRGALKRSKKPHISIINEEFKKLKIKLHTFAFIFKKGNS